MKIIKSIVIIWLCLSAFFAYRHFNNIDFSSSQVKAPKVLTSEQKVVVWDFWENKFPALQESGLVVSADWDSYGTKRQVYTVWVKGSFWRPVDYKTKMTTMKTISRMNEWRDYPYPVQIREITSGEVYGEIMPPFTVEIYR